MSDNIKQVHESAERRYLIIFTLFSILLFVSTTINSYNIVGLIVPVIAILACWVTYISNVFNHKARAIILVAFSIIEYFVYGLLARDFFLALLPFALIIYLTSMLDIQGVSIFVSLTYILIILYHIFVKETFVIEDNSNICELALVILTAFALEIITNWKNKNETINREYLESIISNMRNAEKGKDEFLANVSHEIRTPLNTISGMTELLYSEEQSSVKLEKLSYIEVASRKLQNMLSDVIDYTELSSGRIALAEKSYSYSSVLNDAVAMVTSSYGNSNVEFIIDCDPKIPCGLVGDSEKIYRIICCVLDNAFKFTEKGYVYFKTTTREDKNMANLVITIEDSGVGMSPEVLEKIFDNYNQADTSRSRKKEGIGLGLTITKKMVDLMGGFIHIESKKGHGTTVTIMIPQKIIDSRYLTKYEKADNTILAVYVDVEKYSQANTIIKYLNTYKNMAEGLNVKYVRCESLSKLKYGIKKEKFTRIFMSVQEYLNDPEYFEEVAKKIPIILIMEADIPIVNKEGFSCMYKPFTVFGIADVLNGEMITNRKKEDDEWIAPEAKVLAVDDNNMNLKVLSGLLRKFDIKMDKALSGKDAINMIQNNVYDLIFMDHMMPGMDGVETFKRIRNINGDYYAKVPIIALTANVVNGAREMFLNEGFQDYIAKPVNTAELKRILKMYIPEKKIQYKKGTNSNLISTEEIKLAKEESLELDGFDQALGLEYASGDKDLYISILEDYPAETEELVNKLEENFKSEDFETYRVNVHALKSTSLQIGAKPLSEFAKSLEEACKAGDKDFVKAKHNELMEVSRKVSERVMLCLK